jgi:hypothetical protein
MGRSSLKKLRGQMRDHVNFKLFGQNFLNVFVNFCQRILKLCTLQVSIQFKLQGSHGWRLKILSSFDEFPPQNNSMINVSLEQSFPMLFRPCYGHL